MPPTYKTEVYDLFYLVLTKVNLVSNRFDTGSLGIPFVKSVTSGPPFKFLQDIHAYIIC